MSEDTVRAFLAVPADAGWSAAAAEVVESLRGSSPRASWTKPASWHLTVKFLGNASAGALSAFGRAVAAADTGFAAGSLSTGGPVVFPPSGPPRVLGIGFADSPVQDALRSLAAAAEREARALGLEREDRPWRPHVTLARIRDRWPREAVARFRDEVSAASPRFPQWPVRSCVLYASRLGPSGAVHTPLAEWPLGGGASAGARPLPAPGALA
jgi:2'-5' RNA ligase